MLILPYFLNLDSGKKSIAEPKTVDQLLGIPGALFILVLSPILRCSTGVTATTKLTSTKHKATARQPVVMAEQTQLTAKQPNPRQHETNRSVHYITISQLFFLDISVQGGKVHKANPM